jgi:eukaryotic-like serine/threonine-protein kinase
MTLRGALRRLGGGILSSHDSDERSLLQSRLRLNAAILVCFSGAITSVSLLLRLTAGADPSQAMGSDVVFGLDVAMMGAFLGVWALARSGLRSISTLQCLDSALVAVAAIGVALTLATQPLNGRPDVYLTLGMSHVLFIRAALLPSAPGRTAVSGLLGFLPLVIGTYVIYEGAPLSPHDPPPWSMVVWIAAWAALTIAATVVASHVIYGLRRKVEAALKLGQYTLEERIGRGGMGVVYRASHALLRRPTAIKLLDPGLIGTQAVSRFEREVQTTSKLTHPNTVAIYDFGRTPDGSFYYAMELLDGVNLEELVLVDGPQPAGRVVHILRQVCGALAEAHDVGLVHRDIKPANIMLCNRALMPDFAKVLDFGLVKDGGTAMAPAGPALSLDTALRGTPLYMAPEAVRTPDEVDGRADVYGLGCVAYFLLVGAPLFSGDNLIEILSSHLHEKPVMPSRRGVEIPHELEAVVMACLEKERELRPGSALELRDALDGMECLSQWRERDARAWWTNRADRVRARRPKPGSERPDAPTGTTVAVDLGARSTILEGQLPDDRSN